MTVMEPSKRVLIVEDDIHIADLLRMHLQDEGYQVTHCADGAQGLAQVRTGGWDALILDIMLPGVDGLEICRQARAMTTTRPSSSPARVPAKCTASSAWSWARTITCPSRSRCWNWWRA
jgi:CheY-like chemotaxis protein